MYISDLTAIVQLICAIMSSFWTFTQQFIVIQDSNYSIYDILLAVGWLNLVWSIFKWVISPARRGVKS